MLNRPTIVARTTVASTMENFQPKHMRFPANPNGSKANAGRFFVFSALKRSGSNLFKKDMNRLINQAWLTCCHRDVPHIKSRLKDMRNFAAVRLRYIFKLSFPHISSLQKIITHYGRVV